MVFEASAGLVDANAGMLSHVRTKGLADVYKRAEGTGGEIVAELKRCPFCGQLPVTEVFVTQKTSCIDDVILFSIACGKCGTSKGVKLKIKDKAATFLEVERAMEEVTNAWNTRWDDE
jgi:Lar family restriction alleviation protein